MVDPISNAPTSRQIGPAQNRSQASSGLAVFEVTRDAASDADDSQRGTDPPWPSAELLKLRHYLKQMDALLVDTEA